MRNDENRACVTIFEFEVFADPCSRAVFILYKRKEDVQQISKRSRVYLIHFIIQKLEPNLITKLILLSTQEVVLTIFII